MRNMDHLEPRSSEEGRALPNERADGAMVGQSVAMIDARERVTGSIGYVLNIELPGMLIGRILRSQLPHARVIRVDTARAERLPGVVAVLSRNDLMNQSQIFPYFGPIIRDQPVVAIDRVRFAGDPVAAVAAVDEDSALEALDLIQVEYEELPAVFDPQEALKPGAPVLHERFARIDRSFADIILNVQEGTNLCNQFKLRKGDVEQGFGQADHVFEDVYRSPPVQHVPLEPHVAIAQVESGRVSVWSGTQTPHVVRAQVADIFQVPLSRVRIVVHTLGGGYGAKSYPKLEPITAVLAWKARRPVKIVLARDEDFRTVTKHAVTIHLKTGVKQDGTLVARQSTCYFNAGAYADVSPRLIKNGGYGTAGPYRIPHVRVDSYAVYTNIVPAGAFRGYGVSQAAWAYESQMDQIADQLGIDPLDLRLKNILRDGDTFATGETVHDMHLEALLRNAAQAIGWGDGAEYGKQGGRVEAGSSVSTRPLGPRRRGRAITCVMKGTVTPSTSSAAAKLNDDGSLNVLTSSVEMGQGAKTVLAQIAAEEAGLPLERVLVSEPDTDSTPYDQQTTSSRTTFSMGSAVCMAVRDIKHQLLELAAEQLEVSAEDVVFQNGAVTVKGAPERALSYSDVVRRSRRGNLLGQGTFVTSGGLDPNTGQGIASVHWHHAAAACEVEVDTETGKIEVLRFHANVFAGRMVNPRQCELQTEGSTLFGLGQALFEEMAYDGGQLINPNLADYMIPSFQDLPRSLSTAVLEASGASEIHGIGETSVPPVAPVIANAVARALGIRITELPLTPERVLRALGRVKS
jgi:CO/xanthine dehydrogenase Mo-binding subunit